MELGMFYLKLHIHIGLQVCLPFPLFSSSLYDDDGEHMAEASGQIFLHGWSIEGRNYVLYRTTLYDCLDFSVQVYYSPLAPVLVM